MVLLKGLKRSTIFSGSTLFTNLLNCNCNPALSAVRSFSYGAPSIDYREETCTIRSHGGNYARSYEFSSHRGINDTLTDNPFHISGPRGAYEVTRVEDGLFVRMEMPGIDKEDVKLWVEYGNVYVKGEGKKESSHECNGRSYSGSLEISSQSFQLDKIKAELKNGELRMLIPKTKDSSGTGGSKAFEVKIK